MTTLSINVDGVTGIDETLGNQVIAGVKHDIDLGDMPAGVQTVFNSALAGYSLTLGDAIELAGEPTDGTDGNDVQVSGGNITGLSLTDEDGNLFDGTYDSMINSIAGNDINLKSDPANDNVVLGIDSVTGNVIFAIYLQEVTDAVTGEIIGGDFWVVLFEPIYDTDPNDPDGVEDLTNRLFVSAEQVIDFSFAGAPSGQNEFMAFASDGVVIVASGEANGDSVNSGQGANLGDKTDKTALGTNSQDIGAQEILNFNFTTGFDTEYVVPGLTPTEAGDQNNIVFTDVFNSNGAAFNAVKVTGGGASTHPIITISAWVTEDAASGNLETGTDFISGHADDIQVAIDKVFVNEVDVSGDASMVTYNPDGSVTIIGAFENDRIGYTTIASHNRVAIKNDGNDQVAFSVQAFSLESTSLETTQAGSHIDFYDDGPGAGTEDVILDVWEDALTSGNPDGDPGETAVAVDNLSGIFEPGRDVPGLHFGAIASKDGTTLNSVFGGLTFDVSVNKDVDTEVGGVIYNDEIILSIGSTDHLQILVNENGDIRSELLAAIDHSAIVTGNPDNDSDRLNLGELFEAFDEDGDRQTFAATDVQQNMEDDAPLFDIALGTGELQTDDGALTGGNAGGTATDTEGLDSLFSVVTSSPGADGDGGTVWNLELGTNTTTTLVDTATKNLVYLFDESGDIVGREGTDATDAATGEEVFKLTVDTTNGDTTLTQSRAVEHEVTASATPYDGDVRGLGVTDAILLRGTLYDGEATPDTATDAVDISANLSFTDDGPVFDIALGTGELQTDDGALTGGNAGGTATDTEGLDSLFSVVTSSPGADGDGGTVWNLELGTNTTTTLVDTATKNLVYLFDESGDIVGREGTDATDAATGEEVFKLTVDTTNGDTTLTQSRAVEHEVTASATPYDGDVRGLGVTDAILLRGTLYDGEATPDTATDAVDISANLSFTDDGPAVTVENSAGTYAAGALGDWMDADGADSFGAYEVDLLSYEIDANGVIVVNTALNKTGDYTFDGAITDDFNGDGTNETVSFTLTFEPVANTYDLQVLTPPTTTVDFDTSDGSLDAGGPDPVRTLTIGNYEIVFSASDAAAAPVDVNDFLNQSEAEIEANATYLSADELNVSTAGIANGNNVFEGNALNGVDGVTTKGGKVDESFVVDPSNVDVSSVKVYIDNSVGGYDNPPEDLWYRVYYTDGTYDELLTEVTGGPSGILEPEAGGQQSFTIGDPNGPNIIDAVQLYMGEGTVKIPVIAFTTSQEFDPEALTLNMEGTLTDGDFDSDADTFTIDLEPVSA